jgi:hypothetical protein
MEKNKPLPPFVVIAIAHILRGGITAANACYSEHLGFSREWMNWN